MGATEGFQTDRTFQGLFKFLTHIKVALREVLRTHAQSRMLLVS